MTTQDYIDEEIRRDRDGTLQPTDQHRKEWPFAQILGGNQGPSELILLRAKVRELTDKLAGERARCKATHPEPVTMCGRVYGSLDAVCRMPKGHLGSCVTETTHYRECAK